MPISITQQGYLHNHWGVIMLRLLAHTLLFLLCSYTAVAGGTKWLILRAVHNDLNGQITFVPSSHKVPFSDLHPQSRQLVHGFDLLITEEWENPVWGEHEGALTVRSVASILGKEEDTGRFKFLGRNLESDKFIAFYVKWATLLPVLRPAENFAATQSWEFPAPALERKVRLLFQIAESVLKQHGYPVEKLKQDNILRQSPDFVFFVANQVFIILTELGSEDVPAHLLQQFIREWEDDSSPPSQSAFESENCVLMPAGMDASILELYPKAVTGIESEKEKRDILLHGGKTADACKNDFSGEQRRGDVPMYVESIAHLNAIYQSAAQMHNQSDDLGSYYERRTINWARRYNALPDALRGKKLLAVQGALHFAGPNGLIQLLQREGWRWEVYDYELGEFKPLAEINCS